MVMTDAQRSARFERVLYLRDKERRKWRAIGTELGVGVKRACQIYQEALERRSLDSDHPLRHMSTHARNTLFYHDIESREAAKAAFEAGQMRPLRHGRLGTTGWRGLGEKTFSEIARWANFELPPKPKKKPKRCPHCGRQIVI